MILKAFIKADHTLSFETLGKLHNVLKYKVQFYKHVGKFEITQNIKINLKTIKIQKNLRCGSKFWTTLIWYENC